MSGMPQAWWNWAGNLSARHSFTPAAVTDGVLLRPDGLRAVRSVDADQGPW